MKNCVAAEGEQLLEDASRRNTNPDRVEKPSTNLDGTSPDCERAIGA